MNLTLIKDITVIVGCFIGLLTLIKGILEYSKNNSMKRAEYFAQLHEKLNEVVVLNKICDLLDNNSSELAKLDYSKKYHFLSFFETVALMCNTGLLRKELAHYMFSYYAIRCSESINFWKKMDRNSIYWTLFFSFVKEMKKIEVKLTFKKDRKNLNMLRF